MTLDTKNLPALNGRLAYLEGQYRYNLMALGADTTRADSVIDHDNDRILAEMEELRYVLHKLDPQIDVYWHTIRIVIALNGGFFLFVLYLVLVQR